MKVTWKEKPIGLTVIALYSGFSGLTSMPAEFAETVVSRAPGMDISTYILSCLLTVIGFLLLTSAYALWTLKSWSRTFTTWLYIVLIPIGLFSIFAVFPGQRVSSVNTFVQLFSIIVDIVIIGYLAKPSIKQLFKGHSSTVDLPTPDRQNS